VKCVRMLCVNTACIKHSPCAKCLVYAVNNYLCIVWCAQLPNVGAHCLVVRMSMQFRVVVPKRGCCRIHNNGTGSMLSC
jgi:hypothetical protein